MTNDYKEDDELIEQENVKPSDLNAITPIKDFNSVIGHPLCQINTNQSQISMQGSAKKSSDFSQEKLENSAASSSRAPSED